VRTESAFNQRDMSPAQAVGLMQVTPEAGRDTAKRFGLAYDWNGLVSDPVYNTQMGAAEVAALLKEYRGSYQLRGHWETGGIERSASSSSGRISMRTIPDEHC
jgi:soluble lytic murein transglycosylase-like protein